MISKICSGSFASWILILHISLVTLNKITSAFWSTFSCLTKWLWQIPLVVLPFFLLHQIYCFVHLSSPFQRGSKVIPSQLLLWYLICLNHGDNNIPFSRVFFRHRHVTECWSMRLRDIGQEAQSKSLSLLFWALSSECDVWNCGSHPVPLREASLR